VLADLLGLHIATGVRRIKLAKRDWESYLADRRRRPPARPAFRRRWCNSDARSWYSTRTGERLGGRRAALSRTEKNPRLIATMQQLQGDLGGDYFVKVDCPRAR
jgi:hypothetical protein